MSKVKAYAAVNVKSRLEPFDYEAGPLGPEDVEVKVAYCGICHSDLSMIDNEWGWTKYPLVPGHEVIGDIVAVGSQVGDRAAVGQRVGIGWMSGSCLRCEWCERGKNSLCPTPGWTIVGRHGGFAETVRSHWKFAVPIPAGLKPEHAGPLMCGGATVFTPMVQYNVQPWMKTAVVGVGGLGHMAVQFLSKFGCEVTAISSSHHKDEDTRKLGATRFIATRGTDELKKAANSFDFILSTVSADIPWVDYLAALRPQGRLCIVGLPENDIKFPIVPILPEKSVSGAICGGPLDTKRMLEFAARTGVEPITEPFPFAEINRAIDRVRSGKTRFRAVLVA